MNELFQGKIRAIPLKYQEESEVPLQPNFFVIEEVFDWYSAMIPSLETGMPESTLCSTILYKVVYREILPEKYGKPEQYIERQLQQPENQSAPIAFLALLQSYESIIANADTINLVFSLFTFRGVLDGLVMEVDVDKIQEYLEFLNPVIEE